MTTGDGWQRLATQTWVEMAQLSISMLFRDGWRRLAAVICPLTIFDFLNVLIKEHGSGRMTPYV